MLESDIPFRMLDLNLLRVFDAMMAEGSVAGAATRLSITPSAVSHALGQLRTTLNDPLFIRSPGGMRATPRASQIGIKVRDGLHALEGALAQSVFIAAETHRTFTVACSAYASAVLLPGAIARMRNLAPHAAISVVSWGPGVVDRFEAGQIDVLLGDFVRVPEGYDSRILFEDRPVWLMGRDYVLGPDLADRRRRIESFRPELSTRSVLEYGFVRRVGLDESCGFVANPVAPETREPVLESLPYSLIAPLLVKQANLAALLPRRLAELFAQDLRLDIIEPTAEPEVEVIRIAAIRHPDYGRRAPVAWFGDLLEEAAALAGSAAPLPSREGTGREEIFLEDNRR